MKRLFSLRLLSLLVVAAGIVTGFGFVVLRSGPLAPIPVTVVTVTEQELHPALFGIGTVEARFSHTLGPTAPSRVRGVYAQVGDMVRAGQLVGEMDAVDLDDRLVAQDEAVQRAESALLAAKAQVREIEAKVVYARAQVSRFTGLAQTGVVSQDSLEARQQELDVVSSALTAAQASTVTAKHEVERLRSEGHGLVRQRDTVRLYAPIDGLVVRREAEPGVTLGVGQVVLEIIDPTQLWVQTRFDQIRAQGLAAGLGAQIVLRSRSQEILAGRVARVEPVADAITEELLAKIIFDAQLSPLPALGELAEVTVDLPSLPLAPTIPMACVRRVKDQLGVWVLKDEELHFTPVVLDASDLDGLVQVREGLSVGQVVVVYSRAALTAQSRVRVLDEPGGAL